jgi:hypothetical protein
MAADVLLLVRAQAVPTLAQAERRVTFEDLVRGRASSIVVR